MSINNKDYHTYLLSDKWKAVRIKKLNKCNNRCEGCQSKEKLHIHHLTYRRIFDEHLDDLMVLCDECHIKAHTIWDKQPEHLDVYQIRFLTVKFLTHNKDIRLNANAKRYESYREGRDISTVNDRNAINKKIIEENLKNTGRIHQSLIFTGESNIDKYLPKLNPNRRKKKSKP